MSSTTTHGKTPYYFIPGPSRHPVLAALGLFFVILGASQSINGAEWAKYSLMVVLAGWLGLLSAGDHTVSDHWPRHTP